MTGYRSHLLAGVSALAILLAAPPGLRAQDQTQWNAAIDGTWTWWLEGGATYAGGGRSYVGGFIPAFALGNGPGWEGAAGFDYRFSAIWHVSGQFRYGRNRVAAKADNNVPASFLLTTDGVPTPVPFGVAGGASAQRKEDHWLADFMVGRDMGLGWGNAEIKAGLRIASIRGEIDGSANWVVPACLFCVSFTFPQTAAFTQQSRFFGAGPRLALGQSIPLWGRWAFDYETGIAVLFGERSVSQSVTVTGANVQACAAGCPINASSSNSGAVFNFDAEPGISYAINQNWKLAANYRFDGYWRAIRTFDAGNNVVNVNRFYQGAFLRVTYAGYSASGP